MEKTTERLFKFGIWCSRCDVHTGADQYSDRTVTLKIEELTGCTALTWDREGYLCYNESKCRYFDKEQANEALNRFCQNEISDRKCKFTSAYLKHGLLNQDTLEMVANIVEGNSLHKRGVKSELTKTQQRNAIEAYTSYKEKKTRNTVTLAKIAKEHGVSVYNLKKLYDRRSK